MMTKATSSPEPSDEVVEKVEQLIEDYADNYGKLTCHEVALKLIAMLSERQQIVAWLRETDWGDGDDDLYGALAAAIERGVHLT